MKFRRPLREEPNINLTPLIDVVFLLLIFFMVSTTFSRETQVRIELPEASGDRVEKAEDMVEILVDADGRYFINDQALVNTQAETLKRALRKVAGENTGQPVLITADARTPHQAVVTAMDVAGQLGFLHLRVATRQAAP